MKNDKIFIFDVDGTLTPPTSAIDEEFENFFIESFIERKRKYALVSGSNHEKTLKQVGKKIFDCAQFSFNCNGNVVFSYGEKIVEYKWVYPEDLISFLKECLKNSRYPIRTGNHIEFRPGTINFSIVGRNANIEQRKEYNRWDEIEMERMKIKEEIEKRWNNIEVNIGGEISIDIFPKGRNKSIILDFIKPDIFIIFFGDKCMKGGNDFPLAKAIKERNRGEVFPVKSYIDTWNILKDIL